MRVLLSTSPHVRHAAVLQSDFKPDHQVMYTFAPIGLLSIAAALRHANDGAACEIYDLNRQILAGTIPLDAEFYTTLGQDLSSRSPDVVGFMTECDSYHHVLQICDALKRVHPQCLIILGGPHASAVARETLEKHSAIDAIVIGEGELTFPELLASIGTDSVVAGALRRSSTGSIIDGGHRALVERLDLLPVPAFDLYQPSAGEEMFIEVGRGCPFQCQFCSTAPYWHRRHRVKSPGRILKEINTVRNLFGTQRVHFTHDLFTTNRNWVRDVCDRLISAGAPVSWTCSARTDTVDESLLALMKQAGCSAIYFGLESGSQRILREIKKDIPLTQSEEIIAICKRQGITPNAGFIVGFPSEDNKSLRETFSAYERVLRLGCRPAHIFAFCPFADAAIYPTLHGLACTGHFVDLPLGRETDLRNRQLISSNSTLYGAYFRPPITDLVPGEPNAVGALDEFSSLVEAALAPTLALCEIWGGMYEVFCRWLRYIQEHNARRGAIWYRTGYGTAAIFAQFVLDQLIASGRARGSMIAAAHAIDVNLKVAEIAALKEGTTMASHRSFVLPKVDGHARFELKTRLARGPVLATLALDFDVTPVLAGSLELELPKQATYLAWQSTSNGSVRLIHIDRPVFDALEALRTCSASVGELLIKRFGSSISDGSAELIQPDAIVASLENAANEGLLDVEPA